MKFPPLHIVPVLVVAAIPLLGLKLVDIIGDIGSQAVRPAAASEPPAAKPADAKPADAKPTDSKAAAAKPEAKGGTASGEPAAPTEKPAAAADPTSFSPAEVDLLQALSQRRAELDKRASELDAREMMFKATEQRISEKIDKLKQMETNINALLQKKDAENDEKIKNLVKIYEIMKPQDAARIFEQLDMPVLIEVVQHMKEAKAAPILADMQPQKAKAVTLALAERKQVPTP